MISDTLATVDITVQGAEGQAIPLPFELKDGDWCVSI
jgi:hypothetical protein